MVKKQKKVVMSAETLEARTQGLASAIEESGIPRSQIARAAGVSPSSLSQLLSSQYGANPTGIIKKLEDALHALRGKKENGSMPFVRTSVFNLIEKVCDRARAAAATDDLGLICGHVGVGKTYALRQYCFEKPGAMYFRAFGNLSLTILLSSLVTLTGAKVNPARRWGGGTNADRMSAIIDALTGTERILLVDEAQRMSDACFDFLRDLSDDAQIAVVFCGRETLEPLVQDERGRFGEIASRVGFWPPVIRSITQSDCSALVRAFYGQREPEEGVEAAYWEVTHGSARMLGKLLPTVQTWSSKSGKEITPAVVLDVCAKTMRPQRLRRG